MQSMAGEGDQSPSSVVTWAEDSPSEARLNRKMRKFDVKRAQIFCPIKDTTKPSESPPSSKPFYERFLEKNEETYSVVEPKKHSPKRDDLVCCLKKLIEDPIRTGATEDKDGNLHIRENANIYRPNVKQPKLSSSFDDAFLDEIASFMNHSETDDLFASIDLEALSRSQANTSTTCTTVRKRPATFSGDTPTSSTKAQLQFSSKDASKYEKRSFHKNLNEQLDKLANADDDEENFWNDERVRQIVRLY
ncbi:hypothetical protein TTRE_0000300301 [Trichuris trichiura]|uniref:Uncharacterized protein n=1 Tax=Trichuris trichiura TaxID=36087 RepID=A0A077Z507_TRITR|nr:hypothetical protein TTRE_0000300301 [Trichuris trichiura]